MPPFWLTATGDLAGTDPFSLLVAYGPMGVVLALFLWMVVTGHLVPGREHDRVCDENAELRRQVPDTVAALQASTEAVKEATTVQRDTLVMIEVLKQQPRRRP